MHANARLTPQGRWILCQRIDSGRPVAHVAAEMGVSRTTAYRWWRRWRAEGEAGLVDRSSRPTSCPHRTPVAVELRILELRRRRNLGPARIGGIVGMQPSTVWRVLHRYGVSRLRDLDPPTGRRIRRYERSRPGELVHVDIKKLGRIPDRGGWRAVGRQAGKRNRAPYQQRDGGRRRFTLGYGYIHAAVDDHSRLAYAEVLDDEQATTAAGFWERAAAWFADHGITVEAVMTDNGSCYRSRLFADTLAATGVTRHLRTRPYRPQTNGKVEAFNGTLQREWAYWSSARWPDTLVMRPWRWWCDGSGPPPIRSGIDIRERS